MNEFTREEIGGRFPESGGLLACVPSSPALLPAQAKMGATPTLTRPTPHTANYRLVSLDRVPLTTATIIVSVNSEISMHNFAVKNITFRRIKLSWNTFFKFI